MVAVEEDTSVAAAEERHWEGNLVDQVVAVRASEEDYPQRADEHSDIGTEGYESATD